MADKEGFEILVVKPKDTSETEVNSTTVRILKGRSADGHGTSQINFYHYQLKALQMIEEGPKVVQLDLPTRKVRPPGELDVGDIVVPESGALRSGAEIYYEAVVIQLEPLVLVSREADMRWESTIKDRKFKIVGLADDETIIRCMKRL